ncbi:MAG: hypothetical protein JNL32_09980 [Candidatus Kapabacteria bacterium]|nr:hypothetical protein [Candidatus Kapabacteria bacterium]
MKKYLILVVCAMTAIVAGAEAQTVRYSTTSFLKMTKDNLPKAMMTSGYSNSKVLALDTKASTQALLRSGAQTLYLDNFPIASNSFGTLKLQPMSPVMDGETKIRVKTKDGWRISPMIEMIAYKGEVDGESGSTAFVSYAEGEMYCIINRADGRVFQIVPGAESATKQGNHFMTPIVNNGTQGIFTCRADESQDYHRITETDKMLMSGQIQQQMEKKANALQDVIGNGKFLEVKLALETDQKVWVLPRINRDENRLKSYLFSVISMASMHYQREIGATFIVGDVNIYTPDNPAPYANVNTGDIGELLPEVRNFWRSNFASVDRHLVHMFTGSGSTDVGGIAYRETLCSRDQGYGVSGIRGSFNLPLMAFAWDYFVVTHEIGHNFAAQHTHACMWNPKLDTCVVRPTIGDACFTSPVTPRVNPGSFMSYCHLTSIGENPGPRRTFLPVVAQVIRAGAESRSNCIFEPTTPTIKLFHPYGGSDQVITGGTKITVGWRSARVNTVNVEFTTNGGSSWQTIATNVAASVNETDWNVPAVAADARVRVYSTANPVVGDTSEANFKIAAASLVLNYPAGGERLARKRQISIRWTETLIDRVVIEFSPTGQDPWNVIATGQTGTQFNYTLPDQDLPNAKIRVKDQANNTLVSESGPFAIGTPRVKLLSPATTDSLCINSDFTINWESDFVPTVRVQLSTDGGTTFPLGNNIGTFNQPQQTHVWRVPNRPTTRARIRITDQADNTIVDATPSDMTIRLCTTSSVETEEAARLGLDVLGIAPQPAVNNMTVQITSNNPMPVELVATDVLGKVFSLGNVMLNGGTQSFDVSLRDIPQGNYIFAVRTGSAQASFPFVIVR